MLTDRIIRAVAVLRAGGHHVEEVRGTANVYRVDGRDPVTGPVVLALAIRLGLMDGSRDG
ncbi:hypothetical protein [Methylobacterium sp. J-077]|uniref:hypothetical protein n=1 Tax=Methylobacterium sp. J-077 TaxID=2836656 RepID=UPI001FBBABC5|nr:hypothetical protein [Methylobacterium sp. J-077]MCJ2124929.1 hypothetical protein [Methylobacterium sp. J-077]